MCGVPCHTPAMSCADAVGVAAACAVAGGWRCGAAACAFVTFPFAARKMTKVAEPATRAGLRQLFHPLLKLHSNSLVLMKESFLRPFCRWKRAKRLTCTRFDSAPEYTFKTHSRYFFHLVAVAPPVRPRARRREVFESRLDKPIPWEFSPRCALPPILLPNTLYLPKTANNTGSRQWRRA